MANIQLNSFVPSASDCTCYRIYTSTTPITSTSQGTLMGCIQISELPLCMTGLPDNSNIYVYATCYNSTTGQESDLSTPYIYSVGNNVLSNPVISCGTSTSTSVTVNLDSADANATSHVVTWTPVGGTTPQGSAIVPNGSLTINGLSANTTYAITVTSSATNFTSSASTVSCTTGAATLAAPTIVCGNSTGSTVVVNVTSLDPNGTTHTLTNLTTGTTVPVTSTGNVLISGLMPNTSYSFIATSSAAGFNNGQSGAITCITDPDCSATITLSSVTSDSIVLNFTIADPSLTHRIMLFNATTGALVGNNPENAATGITLFSGLTPNTTYIAEIQCDDGSGTFVAQQTITGITTSAGGSTFPVQIVTNVTDSCLPFEVNVIPDGAGSGATSTSGYTFSGAPVASGGSVSGVTDNGTHWTYTVTPTTSPVTTNVPAGAIVNGADTNTASNTLTGTSNTGGTGSNVPLDGVISANGAEFLWETPSATLDTAPITHVLSDSGTVEREGNAYRIPNLNIPAGATIVSADLTLVASSASGGGASIRAYLENVPDAPGIDSGVDAADNDFPAGSLTAFNTTSVGGINTGSSMTFNFAAGLQQVVNLGGWNSGNAITIYTEEVTSSGGAISVVSDSPSNTVDQPVWDIVYNTGTACTGSMDSGNGVATPVLDATANTSDITITIT